MFGEDVKLSEIPQEMESVIDIPHSTLVKLLTDKAQEIKSLTKKLKKAEDQYAKLHHQRTALNKDKDQFLEFFKILFPSEVVEQINEMQPGQLTSEVLKQKWETVGKARFSQNQDLVQHLQVQKEQLSSKIVQMSDKVAEAETLRSDLISAKEEVALLKGEVKSIKDVNERTSSDYLKFKQEKELQEQHELQEIAKLKEQIETLKEEHAGLNQELQAKEEAVMNLEVEVQNMKNNTENSKKIEKEIKDDANARIQKLYHQLLESKQKAGKLLASKEKEIMELRIHIASLKQEKQEMSSSMSKHKTFSPRLTAASPSSSLYGSQVVVEEEVKEQETSKPSDVESEFNEERMIDKEYMQCIVFNYLRALTQGNKMKATVVEEIMTAAVSMPKDRKEELDDIRNKSAFWNYIWSLGEKAISTVSWYIKGSSNDTPTPDSRLTGFGNHSE